VDRYKLHKRIVSQLVTIYDLREAEALAGYLWEALHPVNPLSHFVNKPLEINPEEIAHMEVWVQQLLEGTPIQHVLGYGYFYGRRFRVSPDVLIPRQETEELMAWIRDSHRSQEPLNVLDIGTGSGCIPISLGLEWQARGQAANLWGLDLSPGALTIAAQNAEILGFHPQWITQDIFSATEDQFHDLDILVSNPPYIPQREKADLAFNVRDKDPDLALFVPDDDPLCFYDRIAHLGRSWLKTGGSLYVEVHADFGPAVVQILNRYGYTEVVLRQDLNKRDRMVMGNTPPCPPTCPVPR